jgi:hypothetical protein
MLLSKVTTSLTFLRAAAEVMPWGWIVLVAVLSIGTWRDAALLTQYPVAVGVDGYYYVLQVDTLWSQTHLFFPTAYPLTLYVLTFIRYVTGDAVVAIKVCVVALHLVLCVGVFALVKAATQSLWLGILSSVLTMSSSLHLYFIVEFINNLGAVVLLVWSCWAAIRFSQTSRYVYAFAAIVCLTGAVFSHRSALPIALVFTGLVLLAQRLEHSKYFVQQRRLIILLIAASWVVPVVLSSLPFAELTVWLRSELSPAPRWPWGRHSIAEATALLALSPMALILIGHREHKSGRIFLNILGILALLSLTFTLNPFIKSAEGWGGTAERLRGLAYVQVAVLVPGLIRLTLAKSGTLWLYLSAALLPLMVLSNMAPLPPGLQPAYLRHRQQMIERLGTYSQQMNSASFVVAPHGDQFVVTAVTHIPSQQSLPDHPDHQTLYWLLRRARCDSPMLPMMILADEGGSLCTVLIKDQELRENTKLLGIGDKQRLLAGNPHIRNIPGLLN